MVQLSVLNFTYGYLFFLNYYSDFFFRENRIIVKEILPIFAKTNEGQYDRTIL